MEGQVTVLAAGDPVVIDDDGSVFRAEGFFRIGNCLCSVRWHFYQVPDHDLSGAGLARFVKKDTVEKSPCLLPQSVCPVDRLQSRLVIKAEICPSLRVGPDSHKHVVNDWRLIVHKDILFRQTR